jgi:dTDP-4-dehydrorhamnose 3,5-epimerase-like enzyme
MIVLKPYKNFTDARGQFYGIINTAQWEEINYIETVAGQIRGGHYHRETRELFFIIEGNIEVKIESLHGNAPHIYNMEKGSLFVVEPYEVHTFICKTDSKWINVLSKRIDDQFHDFHVPTTNAP